MPQIPKPGTYPSMTIQEGSRGQNDPAVKNWHKVFASRTCGDCVHFSGAFCKVGRRFEIDAKDEACVKDFERKGRK
jgi:hypothetical protein